MKTILNYINKSNVKFNSFTEQDNIERFVCMSNVNVGVNQLNKPTENQIKYLRDNSFHVEYFTQFDCAEVTKL